MKSKVEQRNKGAKPPFFRNNAQGQLLSKEPKMLRKWDRAKATTYECWGCGGNHMFRYFPQRGEKERTVHIV
jgi:hypothetical protein